MRLPAVKFRRKIYVGHPYHSDAIEVAFKRFTEQQRWRIYERVCEGKEDIVFGFACADGTDWIESGSQGARKLMYGFKD